jgi:hypothetical protein
METPNMIINKEELIQNMVTRALTANEEGEEIIIKLIDDHGTMVAYNDLDGEDFEIMDLVSQYVNVLEYVNIVGNKGSTSFDEDDEYQPTSETIDDTSRLVGSPFDFSNLKISLEVKICFDTALSS